MARSVDIYGETGLIVIRKTFFIASIIASIILLPWIPMPDGFPLLRAEWFIVLAGLLLFPSSKQILSSQITLSASFVVVCYVLSMIWSTLILGEPPSFSDFTVLMQPVLYFFIYFFIASNTYSFQEYKFILRFSIVIFGIEALITVIQFFNPELISPLLCLYTSSERIKLYRLLRATGTMGNANDLGFLLCIGFALALITLRHQLYSLSVRLLILFGTFVGVLMTGSRTGMLNVSITIIFFFALERKKNLKYIFFITVLLGMFVWCFQGYLQDSEVAAGLVSRVLSFNQMDQDAAWLARVSGSIETLRLVFESGFLGHGPAKEIFTVGANIDNEYILVLYRYGIFGCLATLMFIFFLARQVKKSVISSSTLMGSMNSFIWISLVMCSIFAYTAGIFMSFRLFGLLIVLWTMTGRVSISNSIGTGMQSRVDFKHVTQGVI
jgi:O-antigen ligase